MPRGMAIDAAWLAERYPVATDVNELLDDHEREFGWRPTKTSLYMKASRMGLRKEPVANRDGRVERTVRWSKEPEIEAWMLEHDHGQRTDLLSEEFRVAWGFGLSRGQVNLFRASHGTQKRRDHGGGRRRVPVGSEREGKDGYVVVKVREEATVPMSKDNWELKHVHVYEQHFGPVPEGHVVYFADGDRRNFDPENLVAVPRRLVGLMNQPGSPRWHDRASLEACVALAELSVGTTWAELSMPRTCGVCGREFVPDPPRRGNGTRTNLMTCRPCLEAGHKTSHGGRGRA